MQPRLKLILALVSQERFDSRPLQVPTTLDAVVPDGELVHLDLRLVVSRLHDEIVVDPRLRQRSQRHPAVPVVIDQATLQADVLVAITRLVHPEPVPSRTFEHHVVLIVRHEVHLGPVGPMDGYRDTTRVGLDLPDHALRSPLVELLHDRLTNRLLVALREDAPGVRHRDRIAARQAHNAQRIVVRTPRAVA